MSDAFDKQTGPSPAAGGKAADAGSPADGIERCLAAASGSAETDSLEADEVTGASPGTAQACSELGLNSLEANLARFNIKPPGVS